MSKTTFIGFNQRIQLEWLNQTAEMVLAGKAPSQIRDSLNELLSDKLSTAKAEADSSTNRGKTISILTKIWLNPPPSLSGLHQDGLALLNRLPTSERLAVHWGMSMAVYPFFGQVADTVGRLLQLQSNLTSIQVQRRLQEQLGESETVARATQRVMRCFVDWGVLKDGGKNGIYQAMPAIALLDKPLLTWLLEAALAATTSKTRLLQALTQTPGLYPFSFTNPSKAQLESHPRLELYYQGLDQSFISLRP